MYMYIYIYILYLYLPHISIYIYHAWADCDTKQLTKTLRFTPQELEGVEYLICCAEDFAAWLSKGTRDAMKRPAKRRSIEKKTVGSDGCGSFSWDSLGICGIFLAKLDHWKSC